MNNCTIKTCKGDLYCISSRSIRNFEEGRMKIRKTTLQTTQRRYCCVDCGARYIGTEVLNPQPYGFKKMPKSKRKAIGIE